MPNYNNGSSVPISNLSSEELQTAIKEWAEGSSSLERLLWSCYNNGIETSGCHAGPGPYLGIYPNNSRDKILQMLSTIQFLKKSQILISPDGGNPFSGPNWDKPYVSLSLRTADYKEIEDFFDKLYNSISSDISFSSSDMKFPVELLEYLDMLKDKETELHIRTRLSEDGKYTFSIESHRNRKSFENLNQVLQKAGFELQESEDRPYVSWNLSDTDPIKLSEKMHIARQYIKENLSLESLSSEEDFLSFNKEAHIKKREFGDTPQGREEFDKWLNQKWIEYNKEFLKRTYSKKGILASSLEYTSTLLRRTYNNIKRKILGDENDYQK